MRLGCQGKGTEDFSRQWLFSNLETIIVKAILVPGNSFLFWWTSFKKDKIFYYKYLMHRLCTNISLNFTFMANTNPYAWWNASRISGNMYQTSARFDVTILTTWMLTDTRRSKNTQKKVKFVWKIRTPLANWIPSFLGIPRNS